jgi:hypothetical protein
MPVEVVLEIASTLPTPVVATLLTWLSAFCAAALRLALLEVAEPRAACVWGCTGSSSSGINNSRETISEHMGVGQSR